ncbi:MAG TPA: metallophosphoesterase [Methylomirabilota bacterium]|nr:metallophosphoesterase [Methylomirabilota bacterium]
MLTFAQLSDPHLSCPTPVRARDLLGKRALSYLSWRLARRRRHRPEVLAALVQDLRAARADHVVVTGDLTHLGLPHEFEQARRWLDALGPAPSLSVVPGNHDAYARRGWERALGRWAPFFDSDPGAGGEVGGASAFPSVRVRGPVVFVGLSTARPSAPLLAVGEVGARQLDALGRVLADARRRGLVRVVLMHHPPLAGATGWRKRLVDGARLRAVLEAEGVELVLHGHTHRASMGSLETATGRAAVVGVSSASATGPGPERLARYHLYRLERDGERRQVWLSTRVYQPATGRFVVDGATHAVLTLSRSAETTTPSPPAPRGPARTQ